MLGGSVRTSAADAKKVLGDKITLGSSMSSFSHCSAVLIDTVGEHGEY